MPSPFRLHLSNDGAGYITLDDVRAFAGDAGFRLLYAGGRSIEVPYGRRVTSARLIVQSPAGVSLVDKTVTTTGTADGQIRDDNSAGSGECELHFDFTTAQLMGCLGAQVFAVRLTLDNDWEGVGVPGAFTVLPAAGSPLPAADVTMTPAVPAFVANAGTVVNADVVNALGVLIPGLLLNWELDDPTAATLSAATSLSGGAGVTVTPTGTAPFVLTVRVGSLYASRGGQAGGGSSGGGTPVATSITTDHDSGVALQVGAADVPVVATLRDQFGAPIAGQITAASLDATKATATPTTAQASPATVAGHAVAQGATTLRFTSGAITHDVAATVAAAAGGGGGGGGGGTPEYQLFLDDAAIGATRLRAVFTVKKPATVIAGADGTHAGGLHDEYAAAPDMVQATAAKQPLLDAVTGRFIFPQNGAPGTPRNVSVPAFAIGALGTDLNAAGNGHGLTIGLVGIFRSNIFYYGSLLGSGGQTTFQLHNHGGNIGDLSHGGLDTGVPVDNAAVRLVLLRARNVAGGWIFGMKVHGAATAWAESGVTAAGDLSNLLAGILGDLSDGGGLAAGLEFSGLAVLAGEAATDEATLWTWASTNHGAVAA